ncbi:MAG: hypothetical protein A3A43_01965 [Candidatus Liptonbacteria bacterium RIFCSPLOWO2_01_FULL_56_20]|uniref:ComEC/Rec2-related protein domain-containing protein n=1 Tax=Candidatus Liptonbacteria bacterium RIFCSPLOWO2_01_FULL_56_20 TaxID=1798652 RepID=A0A1G2CJF5_9BACT|nr:MAG: hypothetical protein UY96_C0006G0027 [Parcubacteria group bacterium GW2011_GWB1_56_8]OGY98400.1 MAG: hypothetical protein A2681_01820 [Candidatus Liptonbacteria bacterium RIFCSPHIGHO2_01_FULL_56_18b]OGZ01534.1 MAG: hypothetical protein A3A43_01965 [Candidatus Liptonbacteria bacterium RIFCSPLOWO2_01_FULL_56_20]
MAPAEIAFYTASAFLVGVLAAGLAWNVYLTFLLAVLFIGILLFKQKGRFRASPYAPILLLLPLFAGFFYYHFYVNLRSARDHIVLNEQATIRAVVTNEPSRNITYQAFSASLEPPFHGEISVYAGLFPEVAYGDLVEMQGKIQPPALTAGLPLMAFPEVNVVGRHQGFWLKERLLSLKQTLISQFPKFLPADPAALLGGLTFGSRAEFTKEFKDAMAKSGTTHLVALSGYNIAILVFAVAGALRGWFRRRTTFYLTALVIFLFVLMVGAEASVVRAAIMGFLGLLAHEAGRRYNFRNAVTLTAAAMVIQNPTILPAGVGFQLSFLSLLGMIYGGPVFTRLFGFEGKSSGLLGWRENLTMTLGAQLAVLPILVARFGGFSLTAILANILILEAVPLTMFFGFALACLGSLFAPLGFILAAPAYLLLRYESAVIGLFANIRLPIGDFLSNSFLMVLYYMVFVAVIISFRRRPPT